MVKASDNPLRQSSGQADSEAIDALVRKHVDFVYGTARRKLGDAHLAEDVTQAVFILMIRKARHITNEAAMASWLYQATLYCAANAQRMMRRREFHENRAAGARSEILPTPSDASDDQERLIPLLDKAIEQLGNKDRTIILLHYFQRKTHREVAAATGSSEDAVRKRANRAVERMRSYFASRGAGTSIGALEAAMSMQSPAPAGLAEAAGKAAILSQWGEGPAVAMELTRSNFMSQLTISRVAVLILMLAGSIGIVMAQVNAPKPAPVAAAPADATIKMEWTMPELVVPDLEAGIKFYRDTLGFTLDHQMDVRYAVMSRDGAHIGLHPPRNEFLNDPGSCFIHMQNVDAYFEELKDKGVKMNSPLQDQAYGIRDFQITDPGGNRISFGQTIVAQ